MEWHPDKATGSEENFKKLVKAYSIISNSKSRKAYDRRRQNKASTFKSRFSKAATAATTTAKKVMNDFVDEGLFDALDKFLGRKKDPKNISAKIKITIEELYSGVDKKIKFKRKEYCKECSGSGAADRKSVKMCTECFGVGYTISDLASLFSREPCKDCDSTGKIILNKCSDCKGKGEQKYEREFTFPIPKDLNLGDGNDKDTLILPDEGEYGGDLLIDVNLKNHKYYEVEWPNLHIEVPIKFYQSILGDCLEIETLRGSAYFNIKAGTGSGEEIVLKGYGLRKTDKNKNTTLGNLHIKILLEMPKRINKKQRELLEEYRRFDRNAKKSSPKNKR
jgi:molecular chaperone DnaJ